MPLLIRKVQFSEGIDTQEQLAFLQTRRCAEGQGYLCSRPLPASEFSGLLASRMAVPAVN